MIFLGQNGKKKQKREYKFRPALIIGVAAFIFLVSFLAYMLDTRLEDVVKQETGSSVVTHDTTFEKE
ncbi:MAG: hypothetical protein IJM87_05280 [Ruminococcus sp.]|nr:hypothetical protein [Ruminococcus sp.]